MRKLLLTLKILGAIVALLIVLLVGATFLLNSSSFQNKVMKRAAEMLSERLGTRVTVDSVHVSLMNQVVELYGVDVEDQQQRGHREHAYAWATHGPDVQLLVHQYRRHEEDEDYQARYQAPPPLRRGPPEEG